MDTIEKLICKIIDDNSEKIIDFATDIWNNAELGFREYRTAEKFANGLEALNLKAHTEIAVTGVKSYLKPPQKDLLTVALMGELDALPSTNGKYSNPKTGASHMCGHNAQLAGVFGAAIALTDSRVADALDGNIAFFGVPAEEYVHDEIIKNLRNQGKIKYSYGKPEMIRLGAMNDIDIVVGHHTTTTNNFVVANRSCNGFITKVATFKGVSAHSAENPQDGVDAQNAAVLAMMAVDMQRESFMEKDCIRVHGAITKGASATNIIANETVVEYAIRGKNVEAYINASKKIDRALRAAALATGCAVSIKTVPGNLPIRPVSDTVAVEDALKLICGDSPIFYSTPEMHSTSSGDYGDVSHILPLLQFNIGGFSGSLHNENLEVVDTNIAYVASAKAYALTAYQLLKSNAQRAIALKNSFTPIFTKEEYLSFMDNSFSEINYPAEKL